MQAKQKLFTLDKILLTDRPRIRSTGSPSSLVLWTIVLSESEKKKGKAYNKNWSSRKQMLGINVSQFKNDKLPEIMRMSWNVI